MVNTLYFPGFGYLPSSSPQELLSANMAHLNPASCRDHPTGYGPFPRKPDQRVIRRFTVTDDSCTTEIDLYHHTPSNRFYVVEMTNKPKFMMVDEPVPAGDGDNPTLQSWETLDAIVNKHLMQVDREDPVLNFLIKSGLIRSADVYQRVSVNSSTPIDQLGFTLPRANSWEDNALGTLTYSFFKKDPNRQDNCTSWKNSVSFFDSRGYSEDHIVYEVLEPTVPVAAEYYLHFMEQTAHQQVANQITRANVSDRDSMPHELHLYDDRVHGRDVETLEAKGQTHHDYFHIQPGLGLPVTEGVVAVLPLIRYHPDEVQGILNVVAAGVKQGRNLPQVIAALHKQIRWTAA